MKTCFLILFSLCLITLQLEAQTSAKSIYAEIGGPGITSVNYDTRFSPKENGLGGRIGVGSILDAFTFFAVPAELNYLVGRDGGKNYLELGAGYTYAHSNGNVSFNSKEGKSQSFGHFTIGYRLQPKHSGFLFRAAIVPVFNNKYFIPYWAGIAFGYKFK